jgi:small subunit ribosomal protein S3
VGQKVHPYGFRLGYNKDWHSHWFAKKLYGDYLLEDLKLKAQMKGRFAGAGVSHVDVERAANRLKLIIYTSRPGIIIGRKGAEIDKLKGDISSRTGKEVLVSIQEIHKPELNAQLQAEKMAAQLEKRIAFRRAMRKTVEETLRFGGQGIKVRVAGRLNGAEIARTEWHLQGRLPLHTLRADIDYGFAEAHTTFGVIGVKCWIYRGEILDPAASMARGTQPDPINEPRPERGDGRRPRRDREDGGGDRPRGRGDNRGPGGPGGRGPGGPGGGRGRGPGGGGRR